MNQTLTSPIQSTAQRAERSSEAPVTTRSGGGSTHLAGVGGLVFVACVVVQNILRSGAPMNDADPTEVVQYFADHRPIEWTLIVLFVIGALGLARFVGGLWSTSCEVEPRSGSWIRTGVVGAVGVTAMFTFMVACEVGMMAAADSGEPAVTTVSTLWALHNAIFAVLPMFIAVALLGLSRGAMIARMIPAWTGAVGAAGAALLAVGATLAPETAATTSPLMGVSMVGFLGWLVFLVVASLRLARD